MHMPAEFGQLFSKSKPNRTWTAATIPATILPCCELLINAVIGIKKKICFFSSSNFIRGEFADASRV